MRVPADMLSGRELSKGWIIGEKIKKQEYNTGGRFSICYIVRNKKGKVAFLKAADFSGAYRTSDPLRTLQAMLEAYNFERDLLEKCQNKRLTKIVTAIDDGKVTIPGAEELLSTVHYLIFELEKGDIRSVIEEVNKYDLIWYLKLLHHVAIGMSQLQKNGIAHQDLKPSNVLCSELDDFKISDLGRASDQQLKSPNDAHKIAGDKSYAPIDLYYTDSRVQGFQKKFLTDIYLFGSLIFFLFTGISAVQALKLKLNKQSLNYSNFQEDLPYLQHAYEESINDLRKSTKPIAKDLTEDIVEIAKQLCDPDPKRRGHPRLKSLLTSNYDMQRYISKLDLMTKRAQFIIQ